MAATMFTSYMPNPHLFPMYNQSMYPSYQPPLSCGQTQHSYNYGMQYRTIQPGGKPDPNIKAALENKDVWNEFSKIGTEMIITKNGRRMFPTIKMSVTGLDPSKKYFVFLDVTLADENRYKFQGKGWTVGGKAEQQPAGRLYVHPDSPATGSSWMRQPIAFHKLKLTNNNLDGQGHIIISSMHKYVPRVHIVEGSNINEAVYSHWNTFSFSKTKFIAVTAYQNENITKLKIDYNPFAKGFRESGQSRNKKRAKLSPTHSFSSYDTEEEQHYVEKRPRLNSIDCSSEIDSLDVEDRSASRASYISDDIIDVVNMSECDYSSSSQSVSPNSSTSSSHSSSPALSSQHAHSSQTSSFDPESKSNSISGGYSHLPLKPSPTQKCSDDRTAAYNIQKLKVVTPTPHYPALVNRNQFLPGTTDPLLMAAMYNYNNLLANSASHLRNPYNATHLSSSYKWDKAASMVDSSTLLRGGMPSAFTPCHAYGLSHPHISQHV